MPSWSAKEFEVFGGTGSGSTAQPDSIRTTFVQAGHTLSVGDVVYRSSGGYTGAQADAAATSRVAGIVEIVNGNEITVVMQGIIDFAGSGVSVVDGTVYWLDGSTPGAFSASAPINTTHVAKPVMVGIGTTRAIVINSLLNSDDSGGASGSGAINVPVGTILPWAGAADNIPTNWYLCAGDALDSPRNLSDGSLSGTHQNYTLYYNIGDNYRVITSFNDGGATGTGTISFNDYITNKPPAPLPGSNAWHSLTGGSIFKLYVAGATNGSEVSVTATGASSVTISHLAGPTFSGSNTDTIAEMYGYGTGDAGYTGNVFFLPDLRSRFLVGANQGSGRTNYSLGTAGGVETVTLTVSETPSHTHNLTIGNTTPGGLVAYITTANRTGVSTATTQATGGNGSHQNLPPYVSVNYIIRWQPATGEGVEVGPPGPAGRDGRDGAAGAAGDDGPPGPRGSTGGTGSTGSDGPTGATGIIGNLYVDGIQVFTAPENIGLQAGTNVTLATSSPSGIPTVTINAAAGGATFTTPWRWFEYDYDYDWPTIVSQSGNGSYDAAEGHGFTGLGIFASETQACFNLYGLIFGMTGQFDLSSHTLKLWFYLDANPQIGLSNYKLTFDSTVTGFQVSDTKFSLIDPTTLQSLGFTGILAGMQVGGRKEHVDVFVNGYNTMTRTIRNEILSDRFNFVGGTVDTNRFFYATPITTGAVIGTQMSITGNNTGGYTAQIHLSDTSGVMANQAYVIIRPTDYDYTVTRLNKARLSGCFKVTGVDGVNELLTIHIPYYADDMPTTVNFPNMLTVCSNIIKFTDSSLLEGFLVQDGETLNIGMALGTNEANWPDLSQSRSYPTPLVIEGPGTKTFVGIRATRGSKVNIGPNVFMYRCGSGIVADSNSTINVPFGGAGVFDATQAGIIISDRSNLQVGQAVGGSPGFYIYGCGGTPGVSADGPTPGTSGGMLIMRGSSVYSWNNDGITDPGETGDPGDTDGGTGGRFGDSKFMVMGNNGPGVQIYRASEATIPGAFVHRNAGSGIIAGYNSFVDVTLGYVGNNIGSGVYANVLSSGVIAGALLQGHTDSGPTTSPTGNYDSAVNYNSVLYGVDVTTNTARRFSENGSYKIITTIAAPYGGGNPLIPPVLPGLA